MASEEVTGATVSELRSKRGRHYNTSQYLDHGVDFEMAYCLVPIGKQPDEYEGPQRYCTKRASKVDDYNGHRFDDAAYHPRCKWHGGGHLNEGGYNENLDPLANIKHGLHATDEHLQMDYTDAEQKLHDGIVDGWPEAYGWPDREDDPARYLMLDKVATNVVRSVRAEDYIDEEGEIYLKPIFAEGAGQVGEEDTENPLAREYRLLLNQILDFLKELGLTPKERQKMDTLESQANKHDAVAEIAGTALDKDAHDYDPERFGSDDAAAADADSTDG